MYTAPWTCVFDGVCVAAVMLVKCVERQNAIYSPDGTKVGQWSVASSLLHSELRGQGLAGIHVA